MTGPLKVLLTAAALPTVAAPGHAAVVHVFDDQPLFGSLVDGATGIDFVAPDGMPGLIAADTYAGLGVTLSSSPADPLIVYYRGNSPTGGWTDGWGLELLEPPPWHLAFNFAAPIRGFAAERILDGGSPPTCRFYLGGQLIAQDTFPMPSVPGGTHFVGWVTDFQFDRVTFDYQGVDNIYFQTIPAPGGLALALVGIMTAGRRRR